MAYRTGRVWPSHLGASLGASAVAAVCWGCPGSNAKAPDATPAVSVSEPWEVAAFVYDGSLKEGWQNLGSASRDLAAQGPAKVRFGNVGEWVLARPGLSGRYGGILFRVKEPAGEGEFLEVRVGSSDGRLYPGTKLKPAHRIELSNGWVQVFVPMNELAPEGASFDRIVLRPFRPFSEWVLFDKIALAKATSAVIAAVDAAAPAGARARTTLRARVNCDAKATKISPLIYGIAFGKSDWPALGATARRWGGNPNTRYNWENHCGNAAADWFFENRCGQSYAEYLAENSAHRVLTALTIPMIGWVAKDGTSYSFPVSVFGPQAKTDPYHPDAGNGVSTTGAKVAPGPQTRTSVAAPPEWAKRWVMAIRASDAKTGQRSVYEYILDNEPMLWNSTHRDVHPDPVGYDELLERTVQYGTAIRDADPDALIAGPAEWGWPAYFYSAKDTEGRFGIHTDRLMHGNVPLVEWYLRKLRDHEQKTHTRLLDVLDLHYYPQSDKVFSDASDRQTQLLRLRSTRSLWDPSYVDESWIKEAVRLLPRMKEWVDANYPGRGISIGEWNFGGEKDVTGALATAETLGRFAQFGVTSAFYWTAPPAGSPSSFGFLAYRNFDGRGGQFLEWYVPTTSSDGGSVFASRDTEGKHLVVVVINMSPDVPLAAELDVATCGSVASQQVYVYENGGSGFVPVPAVQGASAPAVPTWSVPAWSIAVADLRLR